MFALSNLAVQAKEELIEHRIFEIIIDITVKDKSSWPGSVKKEALITVKNTVIWPNPAKEEEENFSINPFTI